MRVLVIDVGGTHVKVLGHRQKNTPAGRVGANHDRGADGRSGQTTSCRDWKYEAVSIGYPGPVVHDRPLH